MENATILRPTNMKILCACLAALGGAAIGLLLGTYGVFYGGLLFDKIVYPNAGPADVGLTSISWVLVLFTAPAGLILGGTWGARCVLNRWKKAEVKD